MLKIVEFIESYIKVDGSDYQWNDNHGELVRCKDCKHRDDGGFCLGRGYPEQLVPDDGYCDKGERKEVEDDG